MWLSLFLLAFLIAATYFQAIQGVTSAAIMAVLTVLSLAVSFSTYEYIAQTFLISIKPDFAYPVALLGMFVVPLAVLRVLLDMWIPRSNLLPQILDRGAGAAFGLLTSFLVTGMMAIAVQMVPWGWGGGFLGFSRFNADTPETQNELWLKPDRVAASFGAALSRGVFSGSRDFRADHPDLVTELGWTQSAPRGVRRTLAVDAVSLVDAGRIEYVYDVTEAGSGGSRGRRGSPAPQAAEDVPEGPRAGHILTQVILRISGDADDSDGKKRYMPTEVRLVGTNLDEPVAYPAIAIPNPDEPNHFMRSWEKRGRDNKRLVTGQLFLVPSSNQVEVAFEVPATFDPEFVAYKVGARVSISKAQINASRGGAEERTSARRTRESQSDSDRPPDADRASSRGGRVSGVVVREQGSHFGGRLPFTVTSYAGSVEELEGGALVQGDVYGALAEQGAGGSRQAFSELKVPQGKALLQLTVVSARPGSVLGKALNYSVQTVENYFVTDDRGNQLLPVGKYAIAKVGGETYFEVQYYPEYAASGARAIGPFTKIQNVHLRTDAHAYLVYLFAMEPRSKAVRFSTGRRTVDLTRENLVAP